MKRLTVCMFVAAGLLLVGCEKKQTTTKSHYTDQTGRSYYQDNQPGENQYLGNAASSVDNKSFYKEGAGKSFYAMLSGSQEVPAVNSNSSGTATFQFSSDGSKLTYRLTVNAISDVSGGHIHWAQSGKNGPPVAMLNVPTKKGMFTGLLAEGTITASDLTGPLSGKDLSALIDGFSSGNTYVNIHTSANPDGEIRGQIMAGMPGMEMPKSSVNSGNAMP